MDKKITTKYTIGIREFMNYYLQIPYLEDQRLTHYKMYNYLEEKGYPIPKTIAFSRVTIENIMTGTYLLVREETKKRSSAKDSFKKSRILVYQNPLRESINSLLNNTNSIDVAGGGSFNQGYATFKDWNSLFYSKKVKKWGVLKQGKLV